MDPILAFIHLQLDLKLDLVPETQDTWSSWRDPKSMSRCLENLLLAEQDFGDHRGSSWTLDEIETGLEGNITIAEGILFAKAFIDPYCLPHLLNTHTPPWCWALSFLVICSMDNALLLLCSVQVNMPLVLLWMPSSPAVRQGYVLHVEIHGWSPFLTSNPWAGTPTSHLNTHTHTQTYAELRVISAGSLPHMGV